MRIGTWQACFVSDFPFSFFLLEVEIVKINRNILLFFYNSWAQYLSKTRLVFILLAISEKWTLL